MPDESSMRAGPEGRATRADQCDSASMSGSGDKKQLGKILLRQKLVTNSELDELLEHQREHPGARLGSAAVETGKVDEVDMLRALSEQHGLPGIDLAQTVVPLENLRLIPHDIARQYLILPFSVKDEHLFLAMADPSDRRVTDEIEFVTGRKVFPYVAVARPLEHIIEIAYAALEQGEEFYVGPHAPEDYLAELGLSRPEPPPPPRHPKHRPSAPRFRPPSTPEVAVVTKEDSGLLDPPPIPVDRKAPRRLPTLDPAFASRVAPLPTAPEKGEGPQVAGERVVLIVDDEDDIRRMLRRVLTERDMTVLEAAKGSEALAMVREHEPNAILLDAMLPEIHGFDICRRIKGSKKYGHIPIIMVSAVYRGWRFAEDLKQSYGVADFLEKPFKISEVVQAVERVLEGKEDEPAEQLTDEASDCLGKGIEAYRNGHLDDAIEHLQRGVGLDPLAFRLHYHLGLLYGRRDQLFEGIESLETSVDLSPRNFSALKNLAVLYQRAGFKHKAIEMWERAMGNAPDEETRLGIKDHLMSLL
ncbi:MAG: response regulator [Sandaracinaceae bacterium]|nr:MAG: response regulator [Sandaracinaceae bacterium]